MKKSLGQKLIAGFASIIMISGLVSVGVSMTLSKVKVAHTELVEDQYVSVTTLMGMEVQLVESRNSLLDCMVQKLEGNAVKTETLEENISKVKTALEAYSGLLSSEEEEQIYNELQSLINNYLDKLNSIMVALKNGEQVDMSFLNQTQEFVEALDLLRDTVDYNMNSVDEAATLSEKNTNLAQYISVAGTLAALIIGSVVAAFITKSILKNTNNILKVLHKAAEGDLTDRIEVISTDEMGDIAIASNQLISALSDITKEIINVSEQVVATSEELVSSSEETEISVNQVNSSIASLADGAMNQVQAIQETEDNISNVTKRIDKVVANTNQVNESAMKMITLTNEGMTQSNRASGAMMQIKESSYKTAKVMSQLGDKSEKIGEILEVIKGIASQTNLLALNAAIEAARAGEHGVGFAVVADEVKSLAEQSAHSAEEIDRLISDIQAETKLAIEAMNEGTKHVDTGVEVVEVSAKSFSNIAEEIELIARQIAEVDVATNELKGDSEGVVKSMKIINTVTEEASASTEEIAASCEEQKHAMTTIVESAEALAQLATNLQSLVNKFKVK